MAPCTLSHVPAPRTAHNFLDGANGEACTALHPSALCGPHRRPPPLRSDRSPREALIEVPSGHSTTRPARWIASRCAPRATTVTGKPARARWTPNKPPVAPVPMIAKRGRRTGPRVLLDSRVLRLALVWPGPHRRIDQPAGDQGCPYRQEKDARENEQAEHERPHCCLSNPVQGIRRSSPSHGPKLVSSDHVVQCI